MRPLRWIAAFVCVASLAALGPESARAQQQTRPAAPSDTVRTARPDTLDAPRDTLDAPRDTLDASRDTLDVPADTLDAGGARRDTTVRDTTRAARPAAETPLRPLPFLPPGYGRPVIDSLPARTPLIGTEHLVAQRRGSFLYDFGAVGWPHGWSVDGLAPHRTHLWVDGRPYDDPLSGRPRFDLLPSSLMQAPRTGVDPRGMPTGVHVRWRDVLLGAPLTEIRFRRDNNGLQGVEVLHSQRRRLSLLGRPGALQISAGFGGRATRGVYDGSGIDRERRVWGRLRYQTNQWAVELSDVSSRHRVGSHGGVVPPASLPFAGIYVLPLAQESVTSRNAQRQTYRNDLSLRVRGPMLPPLNRDTEVSATWTSNTFDFRTDYAEGAFADTTFTERVDGVHGTIRQPLRLGPNRLTVGGTATLWASRGGTIFQIDGYRAEAHAFVRDSLRAGGVDLVLDAGWHALPSQTYPSGSARVEVPVGGIDLVASASASGQPLAWMLQDGFATFVQPLTGAAPGPTDLVLTGRIGARATPGPFALELSAFAHTIRDPVDLYAASFAADEPLESDTLAVRTAPAPFRRAGATVSAGWRLDARRGLYARGEVTAQQFLNDGASTLHARVAQTLPDVYGRARIGARFVVFQDLISDVYVQGRGWTQMNSRWLHTPTGHMVVPPLATPVPVDPGRRVGPSGTVDVHAEVILMGAKLFFTFENVQADTNVQAGTFVVPVYPLPARQFRFGVHWPIFN